MATKLNDESLAAPPAAQVTLARSARPQSADLVRVGRAGRPGALLSVDGCRCWRLVVADGNRNVPVFTRAQQPQTPVEVLGCLGGKDGPVDLYLRWSHVGGRLGEARARPGQCPTRSTVAAARRHFHHYPRRPRRHQRQPSPDLPTQHALRTSRGAGSSSPTRSTPSAVSRASAFVLTGKCCCSTRTPWWASAH